MVRFSSPGAPASRAQIPQLHRFVVRAGRQGGFRRVHRDAPDRGGMHLGVDAQEGGGGEIVIALGLSRFQMRRLWVTAPFGDGALWER